MAVAVAVAVAVSGGGAVAVAGLTKRYPKRFLNQRLGSVAIISWLYEKQSPSIYCMFFKNLHFCSLFKD